MNNITINELKKQLGTGLGLRNNKYLLEIPVPGIDASKLNVLVKSAGLPERAIATTDIFHKGRKYTIRAETDYKGTYEVTIIDDSDMNIRKKFDEWMKDIDDSVPPNNGNFLGTSYESGINKAIDAIHSGINIANKLKSTLNDPLNALSNFAVGAIDPSLASASAKYQTDINIWQLSNTGSKVYGYKLQNAFPTSLGAVTLDDSSSNELTEFTVTFSFSEFVPLESLSPLQKIGGALMGNQVKEISGGIQTLIR